MRTLVLFVAFLSAAPLLAQTDGPPENPDPAFLNQIAVDICGCYADKLARGEVENAEMTLGFCLLSYLSNNEAEVAAKYGPIDPTDGTQIGKFGERVGAQMAVECPDIMLALVNDVESTNEAAAAAESVAGVISSVAFDRSPVVVTLKQPSGQPVKFYWLEFFPGSEMLYDRAALDGKTVRVTYRNKDLFSGSEQEYFTRRVITGLSVE